MTPASLNETHSCHVSPLGGLNNGKLINSTHSRQSDSGPGTSLEDPVHQPGRHPPRCHRDRFQNGSPDSRLAGPACGSIDLHPETVAGREQVGRGYLDPRVNWQGVAQTVEWPVC